MLIDHDAEASSIHYSVETPASCHRDFPLRRVQDGRDICVSDSALAHSFRDVSGVSEVHGLLRYAVGFYHRRG